MNTLSRAITAQFFPEPTAYNVLRAHWSAVVNSELKHELRAVHYLLYLTLLGKDWRKAFTPITNVNKLENGAFSNWHLFEALAELHSRVTEKGVLAPFGGLVTPEMLQTARTLVTSFGSYTYKPAAFGVGKFPCEAYQVSETLLASSKSKVESNA
jgi:hypothetical protein